MPADQEPRILTRPEHPISRSAISPSALKVLYRLKDCGFDAFLVGGCVRDILLGGEPKDFDVATNATPEQIRKVFRNCRLIGRRFRLAHIHFGREFIEVATFRGPGDDDEVDRQIENKRVVSDNVYGTIETDAVRRDFTINALYYNIVDFSVRDYVGGVADLESKVIRLIGDPERRYLEDPVRLLRAARFAAKLGLSIEPATAEPMRTMGHALSHVPPARLFDEILKLLLTGHAVASFEKLLEYNLLSSLFPETAEVLKDADRPYMALLQQAMANTDQRIEEGKPVTPAFLFAVLLWPAMDRHIRMLIAQDHQPVDAIHLAADQVLCRQLSRTAVPRRFSVPMREIWQLQPRFDCQSGKRAVRLMQHPRFRAAYDFLLLAALADESLSASGEFWTKIQEMPDAEMMSALHNQPKRRSRRPRRGRRGRRRPANQDAPQT